MKQKKPGAQWASSESLSVFAALRRLTDELDRLGARDALISSNVPVRNDGLPRSSAKEPADPGTAVYFKLDGKDRVLACDRWDRVADNVAAIAAHIAAMRGMDRWGVGTLAQAFTGYAQLPPPSAANAAPWREILQYGNSPPDATAIRQHWAILVRTEHPDRGGSAERLMQLNAARDAALAECRQ